MAASVKDLGFYLSGGASNTDPDASLGGIKSTTTVLSQGVTGLSNITGVTVDDASGNVESTGTLTFDFSSTTLQWTPPSDVIGPAVDVSINGQYMLRGPNQNSGYLRVTVVSASLPGSSKTDTLMVTNQDNKILDDVTKQQAFDGDVNYRCIYLFNDHASDTMTNVRIWLHQDTPGADTIALGADPAGVGNGSSTGVATTIGSETSAPAGVTFSAPLTEGAAITLGDFVFSEGAGLWLRRSVLAVTITATFDNDGIFRARFLS